MGAIKLQVGMGGKVAKVTLSRPEKLNAFNREMLRELADIVRGLGESEKVRIVVLTGEGKGFCAGADLQAAAESDSISNYIGSLAKAFHSVLEMLASCPALVVTLINGPAVGGGFALAMAGDLRFGLPEAKFRIGYGRAGLTLDGGLSWRLPKLVGMAQAQRLIFEDPDVGVDEAQALGLIHRVLPESEIKATMDMLVIQASLQSRMAITRNRQLLFQAQGGTLAQAFEAEAVMMKTSAGGQDGREGIAAFVEKRSPKFSS